MHRLSAYLRHVATLVKIVSGTNLDRGGLMCNFKARRMQALIQSTVSTIAHCFSTILSFKHTFPYVIFSLDLLLVIFNYHQTANTVTHETSAKPLLSSVYVASPIIPIFSTIFTTPTIRIHRANTTSIIIGIIATIFFGF